VEEGDVGRAGDCLGSYSSDNLYNSSSERGLRSSNIFCTLISSGSLYGTA